MCFSVVNIKNNSRNGYKWKQLNDEDKKMGEWCRTEYHTYDKWQNNRVKKIDELIFKTPVVIGKIPGALLTAVCGFSSILQHERRADVAQGTSLPAWRQSILWHGRLHTLQICLKSLQAAQINWSLEGNGTVNISALTENGFKAFLTELWDFTEDHPISKIHNQELVLSPAQL